MLLTPHMIVGATVATATDQWFYAFVYGLISHHILDMIPHTDTELLGEEGKQTLLSYVIVGIDFLIALAILVYFFHSYPHKGVIVFGAIGGTLPDIIDNGPWRHLIRRSKIFGWYHTHIHERFHFTLSKKRHGNWWVVGLITQLVVIGLAIWYLIAS